MSLVSSTDFQSETEKLAFAYQAAYNPALSWESNLTLYMH